MSHYTIVNESLKHLSTSQWAHVNFFRCYWDFGINLQRLSTVPYDWATHACHRVDCYDCRVSQVKRCPDGMGGCSDGLHSWENLNLAGHFFRYGWSASIMCDMRGCRETPTVGVLRWADIKGSRRPVESDPRSSLAQSAAADTPWPAEITATLSQICLTLSQRASAHTLTYPASQIPSQGHTIWHLLDRTGREG